jgi:putative heme transporter
MTHTATRHPSPSKSPFTPVRSWLMGLLLVNSIHTIVVTITLVLFHVGWMAYLAIPLFFLLGFLPAIGGILSMLIAAILGFFVSVPTMLWILLILGTYRALEELFIQPKLMSRATSLPLVVSFCAPIVGGLIAGPVGALVAIPLILLVQNIYSRGRLAQDS